MTSPEIKINVERYLKNHPQISKSIIGKIEVCLDESLFKNNIICNKHELKGKCKGFWRLHVPYKHVVIYSIEGNSPNRYASVLKIMSEKVYHNWIKNCS